MAKDEGIKTNGFSKKKIKGFLAEVDKIDEWSKEQHDKISAQTADKMAGVRDSAENIGIKNSVLNTAIAEHRLRRKADAKRDEFAAKMGTDNSDLVDQLDAVRLAAGMPLFDAAEAKTPTGTELREGADNDDEDTPPADPPGEPPRVIN